MPRKPLSDDGESVQTSIRLSRELYDRLVQAAGEKGISREIRDRLDGSFAGAAPLAEPEFRNVLAAIGQAAAVASLPHPEGWPDSYTIFEAAVRALLRAYRPAGVEAPSPEMAWHGFAAATSAVLLNDKASPAFHRLIELQRTGEQP